MDADHPQELNFYGRRKGKKLHRRRLTAYEQVLPEVRITLPLLPSAEEGRGEGPPLRQKSNFKIPPSSFFNSPVRDVWLEIGFGDGQQLAHQALNNLDVGLIGCEPFINGVAALCADIREKNIGNIRIWPDDARLLIGRFDDHAIGRCFLLNLDPWPKTRHHRRRFVQTGTLDELHRILKPGAELVMSTDDPGLAAWELEKACFHPGFKWAANSADDWRRRPADMPETRYQKKGLQQDRPTVFLRFIAV